MLSSLDKTEMPSLSHLTARTHPSIRCDLPLTVCNLREWRGIDLPEDDALAAHGVPPRELALRALDEAVSELLVPGFRHVGLDTRPLERWAARPEA